MKRRTGFMMTIATVGVLGAALPVSGDGVGWRGDGTGRFTAAKPPVEWGEDKNVIWKTELPKWSNSSPALGGGRIFVCAEPDLLTCVEAASGKLLWERPNGFDQLVSEELRPAMAEVKRLLKLEAEQHKQSAKSPMDEDLKQKLAETRKTLADTRKPIDDILGEGFDFSLPNVHGANGYTPPTPVTDGKMVWAHFGSGVVAAYNLDGTRKWIRFIERPRIGHGHCSSPLLVDGKLIVHLGAVYALDAGTGKTVWRAESKARYGAPVAARSGDRAIVVTANGEMIDAGDGEVLAKGLARLSYNAPVVDGDIAYFFNNGKAKAYRIPTFEVDDSVPELLWSTPVPGDRHYASPVVTGGKVLCLSQKGTLTVLSAEDGKKLVERSMGLKGTCYPSVTAAGGRIYVAGEHGTTAVLKDDADLEQIAFNTFDKYRSSLLFVGDRMYLRGMAGLYCIGPVAE